MYCWIREKLPGCHLFIKGLWFGLLLLFIRDDMLRLPIMNVVVGNPFDVMLVQSLESWLIYPLTGMLIALCIGSSQARGSNNKDKEPTHDGVDSPIRAEMHVRKIAE